MSENYYSLKNDELIKKLDSSKEGLSDIEAKNRLEKYGINELVEKDKRTIFSIFLSQFNSPLIMILLFASIIAGALGETTNAAIIVGIILVNSFFSFYQEYKSEKTLEDLKKYISYKAKVIRQKRKTEINVKELVPGDLVILNVGDIVPADIRLLSSKDLYINEAAITGESFPVRKSPDIVTINNPSISERKNILYMGSVISSGNCLGIVISTGKNTEFGKTATILSLKEPPSDFQKSIKNFGGFLIKIIFFLTIFVLAVNSYLGKGFLDSLFFALALAVGITPELLPIIITISLSVGAMHMAKKKVIIKKLASIEDLGNIDVLCIDKTGTLTENKVILEDYFDIDGKKNKEIIESSGICNSAIVEDEIINGNTIDVAIWDYLKKEKIEIDPYQEIEENEFDYNRKRMSYVIDKDKKRFMICKGEYNSLLDVCNKIKRQGRIIDIKYNKEKLNKIYEKLSKDGYRVIAVSYKPIGLKKDYSIKDENNLVFLGFVTFSDPPKESAKDSLKKIKELGVDIKILTGDNKLVTEQICKRVGLKIKNKIIDGPELDLMTDSEFLKTVENSNVFTRITPEQKYKIVNFLNKNNHIVGFLGDGVNDAPALKVADVGITVDTAVDVAKDSADVILLLKSLEVIAEGIKEGRKTFGNITKYILNTVSANFGNMFTLAISSVYFKFIPLLPSQVLLINFISDVPLTSISSDNVDKSYLQKPKRWNIKMISKFMIFFGLISSIFDILTICLVWFVIAPGDPKMFRTIWFTESVLSEITITFVIRTRKSFFKSTPSKTLIFSSIIGILLTLFVLFYSPIGNLFEFEKLTISILLTIFIILLCYIFLVESAKKLFFRIERD